MSDIHQIDDPKAILPTASYRRLRWRIIPGTFLTIFAVIGSIGAAIEMSAVAYYNVKYGWIQVDPRTPSLNQLAITPVHVLTWQCLCWGTVAAGYSAFTWFYGRWRSAWIGTGMFLALMLTSKWLESL